MTVLYRKYRPQTFADVSGQEHVKTTLAQEVASGALAHSYLFTGPRGVGKTSIARILAKAVNCTARASGSGEPCGTCASCLEITEGRSLDVIEIDAASHTGVDNVREQIIERARFAPAKAAFKVYVIDEAHMLSTAAFNALLKTLEEPPAHVLFVLATTELHKLPATIVSRCQRFDFRRIAKTDLIARLASLAEQEGIKVDAEVFEAICGRSEGCLRDAESLLSQLFSLGSKRVTKESAALVLPSASSERILALGQAVVGRDASGALAIWDAFVRDGGDLTRALADLTDLVRRGALDGLRGRPTELPVASGDAAALLKRLTALRDEMRRADVPELPFEVMVMEWASVEPQRAAPIEKKQMKPQAAAFKPPAPEPVAVTKAESPSTADLSVGEVRGRWTEVLRKAQDRHHSLPYMLGATEIISCEGGELTLGFQYPLYRDRLNDLRHRGHLEAALAEVFSAPVRVKAILVAQKVDGTVEEAPHLAVKPGTEVPDGFAELAKEFGAAL